MGKYRDRASSIDRQETPLQSPTSEESSRALAVRYDNPVTARIGVAVKYMLGLLAQAKSPDSRKVSMGVKLGTKMVTEMMTDLQDSEIPPEIMALYLKQLGAMIMWTATGIKDPSLPWPPDFEV